MYDRSIQDLGLKNANIIFQLKHTPENVELELLRIGSHYISKQTHSRGRLDRVSILEELYHCEEKFQQTKCGLVHAYLEIYEHVCDPAGLQL
jgi:hypothetical protein